ncbi:MAG: 6-bladed beta-propeller [Candidatus Fermentibacteraceae bacterium]|nr:6-bladed beta-propeller [Candidatus Fermentibacteraceae bacterium]MBN2607881.1 6-bladed beta-propeller [Candidatus Fermentibacteraceae bacterium]
MGASLLVLACGGGGEDPQDRTGAAEEDFRTLAVVDSIGILMGDSSYVLGAIEGVAHEADGSILVLDRSTACIKVYDGEGGFIEQIGRRGSAPGELENPISFALLGDGRICVIDPWRGGFLTYNPDHTFQKLAVSYNSNTPALCTGLNDSGFVAGQVGYENENGTVSAHVSMLRYDLQPEPSHVYMENEFVIDFMDLSATLERTLFWGAFTGDRDGNVYFALMEPDIYEITGIREDGTRFMTATREIEQVAKTEQEKADEEAWVLAKLRGWDANWGVEDYVPQPYRNQVRQLGVDGQGRLWALRGTREDPTFDIFDSQTGEFLFTAVLPDIGYQGLFLNFTVDQGGILAYSENPADYPKIYIVELLEQ